MMRIKINEIYNSIFNSKDYRKGLEEWCRLFEIYKVKGYTRDEFLNGYIKFLKNKKCELCKKNNNDEFYFLDDIKVCKNCYEKTKLRSL